MVHTPKSSPLRTVRRPLLTSFLACRSHGATSPADAEIGAVWMTPRHLSLRLPLASNANTCRPRVPLPNVPSSLLQCPQGQVVARPMMYLALTYDHRLIDGREAVTFLKSVAMKVQDPQRLLLDL